MNYHHLHIEFHHGVLVASCSCGEWSARACTAFAEDPGQFCPLITEEHAFHATGRDPDECDVGARTEVLAG